MTTPVADQQGDVALFQTTDGGNIIIENGITLMSSGLETATYLSLFGGNEDDDGRTENPFNWWGNIDEVDPAKQYRSETQNLLQAIPATSGNLRRIEGAAERDLSWMLSSGVASDIFIFASVPRVNRVRLVVIVIARGEESTFEFAENWKAAA